MTTLEGEVKGVIQTVDDDNNEVTKFKLILSEDGNEIKCFSELKLFIMTKDIIIIKGDFDNKNIFNIEYVINVDVGVDPSPYIYAYFNTKSLSKQICEAVIDGLEAARLSLRYKKLKAKSLNDFLYMISSDELSNRNHSTNLAPYINIENFDVESLLNSFLTWWRDNMAIRQMMLLGFTRPEVTDIKEVDLFHAYEMCMVEQNPFRLPSLNFNNCEYFLRRFFNLKPTKEQREYGRLNRYIRDKLLKSKWMCIQTKDKERHVKEFDEELLKKYFIGYHDDFYYSLEAMKCEAFVAKFILKRVEDVYDRYAFVSRDKCSEEQKEAVESAYQNKIHIITGMGGSGKCLGKGTEVRLFKGGVKKVEDLSKEDVLIGDDGNERFILSTTSGRDRMYRITTEYGEAFTCNEPHILTVHDGFSLFDIPLNELIKLDYSSLTMVHKCVGSIESVLMKRKNVHENNKRELLSLGLTSYDDRNSMIIKDVHSHFTIEYLNEDEYYGFELSHNGRFLLADSLITHNTTILKQIVNNFIENKIPYIVTGFTGKAIARVKDVFKSEDHIMTMHMAIALSNTSAIGYKSAIIEEASMVSTFLVYQFLKAYPTIEQLIIVGDVNQLEPIEAGSFMKQLMNCSNISKSVLTRCYRTESTNIVDLGREICDESRKRKVSIEGDGLSLRGPQDDKIEAIKNHLVKLRDDGVDLEDIQCITPLNEDLPIINGYFHDVFFKKKANVLIDRRNFYVGDRVMMLENNYDVNVMNGETGNIVHINNFFVIVEFDKKWIPFMDGNAMKAINKRKNSGVGNRNIQEIQYIEEVMMESGFNSELWMSKYTLIDIKTITHAFCITIHKSQGSEYQNNIVYIKKTGSGDVGFVTTTMLYTGISRGVKSTELFGSKQFIEAVTLNRGNKRVDRLSYRIDPYEEETYEDQQQYYEEVVDMSNFDFDGY